MRFIFSHSALREGWDNPNVFVMGMLKKSDNTISRRQEIGRGLRLAVDQHGERMDNPVTVHDINELTVVTDESYTDFVAGLQKEIAESLAARPRKASVKFFAGKTIHDRRRASQVVEEALAQALYKYLDQERLHRRRRHRHRGVQGRPATTGRSPRRPPRCSSPSSTSSGRSSTRSTSTCPMPTDGRKPKKIPLNEANFEKKEFQELWGRINHKAVYQVEFDSAELIGKCVQALDKHLNVAAMQYVVQAASSATALEADDLQPATGFKVSSTQDRAPRPCRRARTVQVRPARRDRREDPAHPPHRARRSSAGSTPDTFAKFRQNPEQFITEAARLINEQKATVIVEHLTYDTLDDRYDSAIFTENQTAQDLRKAGDKLKKHVYDYVVTDSKVERDFVDRAGHQRRGRRLRQAAARVLHPDPGR